MTMKAYIGKILSCDARGSVHKVLVEDGGRIVYTGETLSPEYAGAERVELGGKALCPAFADTHIHFMSHALFSSHTRMTRGTRACSTTPMRS